MRNKTMRDLMPLDDLKDRYNPMNLVNVATWQELLDAVATRLRAGQGFSVATLNLDHVVKLHNEVRFQEAYQQQTYVVADGNPIVWLRRLMRQPVELIPGSELVQPLCAMAAEMNVPVALFGSTDDTLSRAADRLANAHDGLRIVLCISPPMGFDPDSTAADETLQQVASSGAGLCFVAMGAPKQEIFAARGCDIAPDCGFVSIGAGLDFIAGSQRRAPKWVQQIAMEWLWRMASNPGRLARRYGACAAILPGLAWKALSAASGNKPK